MQEGRWHLGMIKFLTPAHIKTDSWTVQLVRVVDLLRASTLRQCGALKVAIRRCPFWTAPRCCKMFLALIVSCVCVCARITRDLDGEIHSNVSKPMSLPFWMQFILWCNGFDYLLCKVLGRLATPHQRLLILIQLCPWALNIQVCLGHLVATASSCSSRSWSRENGTNRWTLFASWRCTKFALQREAIGVFDSNSQSHSCQSISSESSQILTARIESQWSHVAAWMHSFKPRTLFGGDWVFTRHSLRCCCWATSCQKKTPGTRCRRSFAQCEKVIKEQIGADWQKFANIENVIRGIRDVVLRVWWASMNSNID